MFQESLRLVQVFVLGELISYFIGEYSDPTLAYVYAAAVTACYLTVTLLAHPTFHINYMLGMKMRVACTSLMYRKVGVVTHCHWINI